MTQGSQPWPLVVVPVWMEVKLPSCMEGEMTGFPWTEPWALLGNFIHLDLKWFTAAKTNMEPGNTHLKKDKHLQTSIFWGSMLVFGGVMIILSCFWRSWDYYRCNSCFMVGSWRVKWICVQHPRIALLHRRVKWLDGFPSGQQSSRNHRPGDGHCEEAGIRWIHSLP